MNRFLVLVGLIVMFMAGGHLMDIGDIVEDVSVMTGGEWGLTNGFFNVTADRIYHIGFWVMYASFFLVTFMYMKEIAIVKKG